MNQLFYELLKVSIGSLNSLSCTPTKEEWDALYKIAEKHALVGITFFGLKKVLERVKIINISIELKMQWIGMAVCIQKRNELMNTRCKELKKRINDAGLKACILKGQGLATYYKELALFRQSGDIDMWVKGGYDVVCDYVQRTCPSTDLSYHRFHYDIFDDMEVEIHHRPSIMNNPFHNRKLQRWADELTPDLFVYNEYLGFDTPTSAFNKLFLLCHIYRHFLSEGIGLRQLTDYYFVLRNSPIEENPKVMDKITQLGMKRFASAVMWALQEVFALDSPYLLCPTDEKEGRYLLNEIMTAGNFGHHDKRYAHSGRFSIQKQNIRHSTHLLFHYPSEILWMPLWLVWHFFWKRNKRKRLYN